MRLFRSLGEDISQEERLQVWIKWGLRAAIAIGMGWALARGEWEAFFISVVALGLSFGPEIIESTAKVSLPIEFDIVIVMFIFFAVFLGEVGDAYEKFWWWDAVLHTTSGVILGFVGFLVLYVLYAQKRLQASPFIVAFFVLCAGVAFGAVWEIFEYAMDKNFSTNMQKNGLQDTMWDLIVDTIGSLAVAIAAYRQIKDPDRGRIVARLAHRLLDHNPKFKKRRFWVAVKRNFRPSKLLWIDLEMTGLDPDTQRIIEVGVIITDFEFRELASYEAVIKQSDEVLATADPWVQSTFTKNGLFERVRNGREEREVTGELIKLIETNFEEPAILAGNTIHQDRRFIRRWWPEVEAKLHYRMLDVSSFKIWMHGRHNEIVEKPEAHRALEDIRGSIAELKHYAERFPHLERTS